MRAAIYTRQSLDREGTGLAVTRQLEADERLCADRGWDIVARESDNDMSAYSTKPRPGYQRIVALMETGKVDVVVVWAVDRLTRRLADLVDLIDLCERTGVKVATVSGDLDLSTASGRLIARILGSVAQGEVETKSVRQKAANRQAAEQGRPRMGGPRPFGWLADRMTAHPVEGPAVADACRAVLAGGTISGVARQWNAAGLKPAQRAAKFTRSTVRTILASPRIAGLAAYHGEITGAGEWDALVTEETWRAVLAVLDGQSRPQSGVRTMLGGLAKCRCGNTVSCMRSYNGTPVYRCPPQTRGDRSGPHVAVRAVPVDEFIGNLVCGIVLKRGADLLAPEGDPKKTRALRDEAQALRARLKTLGPDWMAGKLTEADAIAAREWGDARLAAIATELADLGRGDALADLVTAADVEAVWKSLGTDRKRAAVTALMTIVLNPAGRGARVLDLRKVVQVTPI